MDAKSIGVHSVALPDRKLNPETAAAAGNRMI